MKLEKKGLSPQALPPPPSVFDSLSRCYVIFFFPLPKILNHWVRDTFLGTIWVRSRLEIFTQIGSKKNVQKQSGSCRPGLLWAMNVDHSLIVPLVCYTGLNLWSISCVTLLFGFSFPQSIGMTHFRLSLNPISCLKVLKSKFCICSKTIQQKWKLVYWWVEAGEAPFKHPETNMLGCGSCF